MVTLLGLHCFSHLHGLVVPLLSSFALSYSLFLHLLVAFHYSYLMVGCYSIYQLVYNCNNYSINLFYFYHCVLMLVIIVVLYYYNSSLIIHYFNVFLSQLYKSYLYLILLFRLRGVLLVFCHDSSTKKWNLEISDSLYVHNYSRKHYLQFGQFGRISMYI